MKAASPPADATTGTGAATTGRAAARQSAGIPASTPTGRTATRWRDRDRWQGRGGCYGSERGYREGERDFWDKAGDEVSSWFGDEDARRRRDMDQHRGRGPRNYVRSDERIKEDVNDRLTDDGFLDATEIECSVDNREVTLSGTVDSRQAKRRAEDLADSVSGVTNVQNNLRVRRDDDVRSAGASASTGGTSGSRARKTTGM